MTFTEKQIEQLSEPILAKNVKERDGNRAGTFQLAYVEGWQVINEANRIFGFDGWSSETIETTMVNAEPDNVTYIAKVKITVGNVIREGTGAGHGNTKQGFGINIESAIKEAETDARKRALMQFGNQFGLSLYNGKDKSWRTNQAEKNSFKTEKNSFFDKAKNFIEQNTDPEKLNQIRQNIERRFNKNEISEQQRSELFLMILSKDD